MLYGRKDKTSEHMNLRHKHVILVELQHLILSERINLHGIQPLAEYWCK